jgi:hypothetical protein
MSSSAGQLLTLAGVAIGILGTILATTVTDKARWKREQAVRWDTRRLDAYAEYARTIKEIHALTLRLIASRTSDITADPIDRDAGLETLTQTEFQRTKVWESVLLLGDTVTVAAARDWRNAVWQLELLARTPTDDGISVKALPAVRAANGARDRFYVAARESLNVGGGSVEQASWLLLPEPRMDESEVQDLEIGSQSSDKDRGLSWGSHPGPGWRWPVQEFALPAPPARPLQGAVPPGPASRDNGHMAERLEVQRVVAASAGEIFAVLSDPRDTLP